jgi:predicted ArsR family transcriptional regulator
MGRLDTEARITIKVLSSRGTTTSDIARILGVTEGTVRYHLERMHSSAVDGRSRQAFRAEAVAEESIKMCGVLKPRRLVSVRHLRPWPGTIF